MSSNKYHGVFDKSNYFKKQIKPRLKSLSMKPKIKTPIKEKRGEILTIDTLSLGFTSPKQYMLPLPKTYKGDFDFRINKRQPFSPKSPSFNFRPIS